MGAQLNIIWLLEPQCQFRRARGYIVRKEAATMTTKTVRIDGEAALGLLGAV